MKKEMAGLVAALLLTTAGTAVAEQRAGAFTLSPFVGGYTFDGVQRLETRPTYGLRLGYDITKNFGIEATFDYVSTKPTGNTTGSGGQIKPNSNSNLNVYNYRLEGVYNFMPQNKLVPFVAVGGGGSTITNRALSEKSNNDATLNAGAGVKYFLSEDVALRADTRAIVSFHHNTDFRGGGDTWLNYEYTLGVQFLFGGKKPVVAVVVPPPAPKAEPKVIAPPPPPPAPAPVAVDGSVGAWSDWSACSAPCGPGSQNRTRPVVTQPANGGAPLPALSESRSCTVQACMEEEKINLLIEFDFDKAVVKKEFYPNADAVGTFMKKNEKLAITVDGWTDKTGSDTYNKNLSQRRAEAVKAYLVNKHKINPARITAVGHGKSFKYDNKTEAGRYKNRRVEMNQTVMVEKK